ncbi:MAG: T9SS type A sorting domain-containing protein [Bacteroidota bacterium]
MKTKFTFAIVIMLAVALPFKGQIDLNSGTTGYTTSVGQSYNETRAVDAKVISPNDLLITGVTLHGFNVGFDNTALVGFRVYDSTSHALLYSQDTTVYNIYYGNVHLTTSYVLHSNQTYRIGLFCGGPSSDNSAYEFVPTAFPYVETHGLLRIEYAYAYPADVCPTNMNLFVPLISLSYDTIPLSTGIAAIESAPQASVFPNPANDIFSIVFPSNEPSKITIRDMLSNELFSKEFINSTTINTANLPRGIYLYEIKNSNETIKNGKVLKM